jgi:hypothetical protein
MEGSVGASSMDEALELPSWMRSRHSLAHEDERRKTVTLAGAIAKVDREDIIRLQIVNIQGDCRQ